MKKVIAAIDQGTTSTRCILFDEKGCVVSISQKEHQQIFPKPGWVEHDPIEIWQNTRKVILEAIQSSGLTEKRYRSIWSNEPTGIDLPLEQKNRYPISQCDRLAGYPHRRDMQPISCRQAELTVSEIKTGLPLATYFSGPKITMVF